MVLDVSGSMKESVEGGVKNELARRGLLATLANAPADTQVSLRLLGQGPGDDECTASEQVVPFGPFDPAEWDRTIRRLDWSGATPLSHSLLRALDDLRGVEARRREVLLISDGDETCHADPVSTAREHAQGVRVHTISLGKGGSNQLAGIALVTGGSYFDAYDDVTFQTAIAEQLPSPPRDPVHGSGGGGGTLEIILDVSNSMWGQVDGRTKIDLAREALERALAELPAEVPVSLRAYGHRVPHEEKEAACRDTELLVPPTPGGAAAVTRAAAGLVPTGQTPIALSLRAAGDDLATAGGQGVLLLISDGIESCGGDPVSVAAELRASGLPVVVHTVGLGVEADAAAALSQLAAAGGGQYFDAATADDLIGGVGMAVRSSREFVLDEQDVASFPHPVRRVRGGNGVENAQVLVPGFYSFEDHLVKEWRYFVVRGSPGREVEVNGLVCALDVRLLRNGTTDYTGNTCMMTIQRVDATGERERGPVGLVRGDMGEWSGTTLAVGSDGVARFRIGRPQGIVHRDMLFEVRLR